MKNGTYHYEVTMMVPLGKRNGTLKIAVLDDKMTGYLTMFTETLPITEGTCNGEQLTFSGQMKTLLNTFGYVADGIITQDQIELQFHTERGEYPAVGRRTHLFSQEGIYE